MNLEYRDPTTDTGSAKVIPIGRRRIDPEHRYWPTPTDTRTRPLTVGEVWSWNPSPTSAA